MTKVLTDQDKRILDLAQHGHIQEYLDALLDHPEKGRLLRVLAQEESAPEHEEFVKRMQAKEYTFHIHRHVERDHARR